MTHIETLDMVRRLVSAMQMGILIQDRDGHRWIELHNDGDNPFEGILKKAKVCVNNKIYGSYGEALFVIDDALRESGSPTLLGRYYQRYSGAEDDVFGEPNPSHGRVYEGSGGGVF